MQYKKKIIYLFMTLLCVFLLTNVSAFADLPKENSNLNEIPNLEGEETFFGKLTKESEDIITDSRLVYKSNWAGWWQKPQYETYNKKMYVLYNCEKLVDIPYETIWNVGLDKRGTDNNRIDETELVKKTSTKKIKKINEEANRFYIEFSKDKKTELGVPIDIVNLKAIQSNGFKFGWEHVSKKIEEIEKTETISYDVEREYHFINNYDEPVFVRKCFRQRFNVVLMCEYEYDYEDTKFGSGAAGWDENHKYEFKGYKCITCRPVFVPTDIPYFKYTIYFDRGSQKVCLTEVENVIFI